MGLPHDPAFRPLHRRDQRQFRRLAHQPAERLLTLQTADRGAQASANAGQRRPTECRDGRPGRVTFPRCQQIERDAEARAEPLARVVPFTRRRFEIEQTCFGNQVRHGVAVRAQLADREVDRQRQAAEALEELPEQSALSGVARGAKAGFEHRQRVRRFEDIEGERLPAEVLTEAADAPGEHDPAAVQRLRELTRFAGGAGAIDVLDVEQRARLDQHRADLCAHLRVIAARAETVRQVAHHGLLVRALVHRELVISGEVRLAAPREGVDEERLADTR